MGSKSKKSADKPAEKAEIPTTTPETAAAAPAGDLGKSKEAKAAETKAKHLADALSGGRERLKTITSKADSLLVDIEAGTATPAAFNEIKDAAKALITDLNRLSLHVKGLPKKETSAQAS